MACPAWRAPGRWAPAGELPLGAAGGGRPTAEPHRRENAHWEVAPCGVHLLHGPRLGVRGVCGAVIAVSRGVRPCRPCCKVTCLAPAEPGCVCLPHKEISAFAFCLFGFFLRLMHAARVPLLQLFCDTAQPSNVGSPAQRAAVTDSLVQAGQVPNLLFIRESSAEWLDRFWKHWRTSPGSFLPFITPFPHSPSSQMQDVWHFNN